MVKYTMIIDNEIYKALFTDHFEAGDFLDECVAYGSDVVVVSYEIMTVADVLADPDFEHSYAIELIASVLLANASEFTKWTEQEDELIRLGYIS